MARVPFVFGPKFPLEVGGSVGGSVGSGLQLTSAWRVRSRLYRGRCLRVDFHVAAFFELYLINNICAVYCKDKKVVRAAAVAGLGR